MPPVGDDLVRILTPVVHAAGYDLEGIEVSPAGRRRRVRVLVDKDGGVDLDECAELSRAVGDTLDDTDALGSGAYVLEVSSPGVGRPLRLPRHWRRASGRLVAAALVDGSEVTGRVSACDEDGVGLAVAGGIRRLAYDQVAKARVQVEFSKPEPADEPGGLAEDAGADGEDARADGEDAGADGEDGRG